MSDLKARAEAYIRPGLRCSRCGGFGLIRDLLAQMQAAEARADTLAKELEKVKNELQAARVDGERRAAGPAGSWWQPIETAPKDGTAILACVEDYTNPKWNGLHPGRGPITVYWGAYHPNSPGKGEWRDGNGHKRPHLTHWMPLFPAPSIWDGLLSTQQMLDWLIVNLISAADALELGRTKTRQPRHKRRRGTVSKR